MTGQCNSEALFRNLFHNCKRTVATNLECKVAIGKSGLASYPGGEMWPGYEDYLVPGLIQGGWIGWLASPLGMQCP